MITDKVNYYFHQAWALELILTQEVYSFVYLYIVDSILVKHCSVYTMTLEVQNNHLLQKSEEG